MIHQPLGGAQGGQTDIDIQAWASVSSFYFLLDKSHVPFIKFIILFTCIIEN